MRPTPASKTSKPFTTPDDAAQPLLFMVLAGLFFFIAVVKLGIPVVLDYEVSPPNGLLDAIFGYSTYSWQVKWGYLLMIPVLVAGLLAIRWKPLPGKRPWLLLLPLVWLGWEFVSAAANHFPNPADPVLAHFSACVAFFYLGFFALRGVRNPWPIWAGLGLALCWVLHIAMTQHFGGLEATRKMALEGNGSDRTSPMLHDPAFINKLSGLRVFGSFMYPNGLAAGLLLLLPFTLVFLWKLAPKVRLEIRVLFVAIFGGCGLACLYWSGSKAAWLFMVFLGVLAIGHSPLKMAWKRTLIYGLIALGLIGFTIKYVDSASRGKKSMEARLVYWQAALQITRQHPIIGTGPGTFGSSFKPIRPAKAEWAALAHNDFLEQASDSGIIGFLAFSGLVVGSIAYAYRYRLAKKGEFYMVRFAVWLGLLGLFLHSGMEFNLYYPALAWPSFFLLGWLWGLPEE
ncbi:MAG: O-antigen ligase family protein [Verrucomicrobiota bacterium]|jgi:O-antigen ligase